MTYVLCSHCGAGLGQTHSAWCSTTIRAWYFGTIGNLKDWCRARGAIAEAQALALRSRPDTSLT